MNERDLTSFLEENYNLGEILNIEKLGGGVSNINYQVKCSSATYVVRICNFEPENQVRLMIPFLDYAESVNYPAARLVKTTNGDAYRVFNGSPVIVTTFVNGAPGNSATMTDGHIVSLGKALARFHSLDWSPQTNSKTLRPSYILGVYEQFPANKLVFEFEGKVKFINTLKQESTYFSSVEFSSLFDTLQTGLVHGDLIPGNVLFSDEGEVQAFVDLEEVGTAPVSLDIARVINNWFFNDSVPNIEKIKLFIGSYVKIKQLNNDDLAALPIIMRFIAFKHSIYAQKMLVQNRISNVDDFDDYHVLEYLIANDFVI